jgi:hypothetical protein
MLFNNETTSSLARLNYAERRDVNYVRCGRERLVWAFCKHRPAALKAGELTDAGQSAVGAATDQLNLLIPFYLITPAG